MDILVRQGIDPLDEVMAITRDEIIHQAINKLSYKQKIVIEKTVYSNMSLAKVGEKLGICKQRAFQLRQSGFKKLEELLQGKLNG